MSEPTQYARWFRDSTPYISAHRHKMFVVLLGGDAIAHEHLTSIVHDLALLSVLGARVVLVHGARQQIDQALTAAGLSPRSHRHRPILDQAGIELARRLLREEVTHGSALTSPEAVRDYLRLTLAALPHEAFVVLFLDSQHRLLAADELFRGTLAQTSVYPREIVKAALAHNAAAVIFAHNHPSGVAEPSRADELLTQALKQALALVDIRTLDHFVVAGHRVVSFAERGLL